MIRVENLRKEYSKKIVLDIPKLDIEKSSINCFVGENGSGKSTFIFIVCGLIYQTHGIVEVDGKKNTSDIVRKNSHVVLESGKGFYEYLSAIENIKYFLGINGFKYKNMQKEFLQWVDHFKFDEHLNKKVSELSQGNRQKLSVILAFLLKAPLTAFDEPTNGLDDYSKCRLIEGILNLEANGCTILITTHDEQFLASLRPNIFRLENGKISYEE